jgi:hypothetical protein
MTEDEAREAVSRLNQLHGLRDFNNNNRLETLEMHWVSSGGRVHRVGLPWPAVKSMLAQLIGEHEAWLADHGVDT